MLSWSARRPVLDRRSGRIRLAGVALGQQADEPTERLVLFFQRERLDDEHVVGLEVEVSGSERPRFGSGGRLIGSEDAVVVSHG